jgi:hypothetical protein
VYPSICSHVREDLREQKHRLPVNLWGHFGNLQGRFDSDILNDSIREIVEDRGYRAMDHFNDGSDKSFVGCKLSFSGLLFKLMIKILVCATAAEN